jgi:CubicO group peptidase (beta-lactamase class C family)
MTNRSGISDAMVQSPTNLFRLGTLSGDQRTQRDKMVPIVLKTAANGSPGANFEYSNFAYAVLGAMAERAADSSFESLMVQYVFKPLGMDTAGFGPQGTDRGRKLYQPRGHNANGSAKTNSNDDLLPYLAPAGTMSMSVVDWGKFIKAHMGLKVKKRLLVQPATLQRLHTPYAGDGTRYAAGWVVTEVLGTRVLSHDGTNGNWYSTVQLIPSLKYAVYDVVNQGGSNGFRAAYDIKEKLISTVPFL